MNVVLRADSIFHQYDSKPVLKDISFTVGEGEIVSLIGPSGAGKTTLLKIIAGIVDPSSGSVTVNSAGNGRVVLVFQDYMLFPHMTVFNNVAFGLRSDRRLPKTEIRSKVMELLDYFGIAAKAAEYPGNLSGGQKQRVALARALIVEPVLLLLDEPFANLDRSLKMETALFIRDSIKDFGSTALMVTHDIQEASAVSERMGLLLEGRICQLDTVSALYTRPKSREVAAFLGPVNTFSSEQYGRLSFKDHPATDTVVVRAQELELKQSRRGAGEVLTKRYAGPVLHYVVRFDRQDLDVYSLDEGLQSGDRVSLRVKQYIGEEA